MKSSRLSALLIILTFQFEEREATRLNCGKRLVNHDIQATNGFQTNEGVWPWHAAIFDYNKFVTDTYICGGTVLTSNSVLTAAHCLYESGRPIIAERVRVKLGTNNLYFGNHIQLINVNDIFVFT